MDKWKLDTIQKNLSYSYLHTVTSRAGGSCEVSGVDIDGMGIDAWLTFNGCLSDDPSAQTEVRIGVQLKSTRQSLTISGEKISYPLDTSKYTKYSQRRASNQLLFILFCVPEDTQEWLTLTEDELVLRKCAYWTGLVGAPPCAGKYTTVHIPKKNLFSSEQLQTIVKDVAEWKDLRYGS